MKASNVLGRASVLVPMAVAACAVGLTSQSVFATGKVVVDQSAPLITDPGGCPTDPLSEDSELQNQPGVCANILGFGNTNSGGFFLADDFTLTSETNITGFNFYSYNTGATTLTMTTTFVEIWDGPPGTGSVVFGDHVTNVIDLANSQLTSLYRSTEVGANMDLCNRRIQRIRATINVTLPAGTYWIAYSQNAGAAAPFVPPLTVEAGPPVPGNAMQRSSAGIWAQVFDTGIPGCVGQPPAPGYPVELPFQVLGRTVGGGCTGDLNGDNNVNVDDLLIVIGNWGGSGPAGDANGDGIVDVDDLLLVIGAWGACP